MLRPERTRVPAPFLVRAMAPPVGFRMLLAKVVGAVAFCVLNERVLVPTPVPNVMATTFAKSAVPNSPAPPTLKVAVRPLAIVVPDATRLAAVR